MFFLLPDFPSRNKTDKNDNDAGKASELPNIPPELEQVLGPNPDESPKVDIFLDDSLLARLRSLTKTGIGENTLDFLLNQYNIPDFAKVPKLNIEIEAYINTIVQRRETLI